MCFLELPHFDDVNDDGVDHDDNGVDDDDDGQVKSKCIGEDQSKEVYESRCTIALQSEVFL